MIAIELRRRVDVAPPAAGCFAFGDDACARLWSALYALDDARLRTMRGVRSHDLVVVVGASDELPWCAGIRYLAEATPGLFVPTTRALSVPAPLVAQGLARQLPCALVDVAPDDVRIVPLKSALALSRAGLERGAA